MHEIASDEPQGGGNSYGWQTTIELPGQLVEYIIIFKAARDSGKEKICTLCKVPG